MYYCNTEKARVFKCSELKVFCGFCYRLIFEFTKTFTMIIMLVESSLIPYLAVFNTLTIITSFSSFNYIN